MLKTALSAFIALAVLAPAASAADEVKPPRHTEQAAPTCRPPAPAEVDPKAPPAPRLTKLELEALAKLPLCSVGETCLMVDQAVYEKQMWTRSTNGALPPAWVQNYDECMSRQPGNGSGADGSYDGGRDRSLHTT